MPGPATQPDNDLNVDIATNYLNGYVPADRQAPDFDPQADLANRLGMAVYAHAFGIDPDTVHPDIGNMMYGLGPLFRPSLPMTGLLGPTLFAGAAPSATTFMATGDVGNGSDSDDLDADFPPAAAKPVDDSTKTSAPTAGQAEAAETDTTDPDGTDADYTPAAAAPATRVRSASSAQKHPAELFYPRSWDPLIEKYVRPINLDHEADPGDDYYLDPDYIKAMIRTESGHKIGDYMSDPMQVNNHGDWVDAKALEGLTDHVAPGPALGIRAGLDWLAKKAFYHDGKGGMNFLSWRQAIENYNGKGNPRYMQEFDRHLAEIKSGR